MSYDAISRDETLCIFQRVRRIFPIASRIQSILFSPPASSFHEFSHANSPISTRCKSYLTACWPVPNEITPPITLYRVHTHTQTESYRHSSYNNLAVTRNTHRPPKRIYTKCLYLGKIFIIFIAIQDEERNARSFRLVPIFSSIISLFALRVSAIVTAGDLFLRLDVTPRRKCRPLTLGVRNQGLPAAAFSSVIGSILPSSTLPSRPPARSQMGRTGTHARNGFVFLSCISPFYFVIKHFHIAFTRRMKVPSAREPSRLLSFIQGERNANDIGNDVATMFAKISRTVIENWQIMKQNYQFLLSLPILISIRISRI